MSVPRHTAKMTGEGIWVQLVLENGDQVSGRVVTGTFDEFRFATREVARLDENGLPQIHLNVIRTDAEFIEVVVPMTMPVKMADRARSWVEQMDDQYLGRPVEIVYDDDLLDRLHRCTSTFWKIWDKVMTWFGRKAPMILTT